MRQIKFRGLSSVFNSVWRFGYLTFGVHADGELLIEDPETLLSSTVDKETVGQFIGLCDVNGNEIYEGDILRFENNLGEFKGYITFYYNPYGSGFRIHFISQPCTERIERFEIIGNIHENKDMIVQEE